MMAGRERERESPRFSVSRDLELCTEGSREALLGKAPKLLKMGAKLPSSQQILPLLLTPDGTAWWQRLQQQGNTHLV